MGRLVLVVEDNQDVLFNLKMTLEFDGYEVATAADGQEALQVLTGLPRLPDLIISDIMMPRMNGYDFFTEISQNPKWNLIPFLFLTAKATPEDIRFGKMLGVDDYLTKPIKREDLLATVGGKIDRSRALREHLEKSLSVVKQELRPSLSSTERNVVILLYVAWDQDQGPVLENFYTKNAIKPESLSEIGIQLFHSTVSIYGQGFFSEPQGLLLKIENINQMGYIFFDSIPDKDSRGGYRLFMLGALAPRINYFESLRIRDTFIEIAGKIKTKESWQIEGYWEKIAEILAAPTNPS